MSDFFADINAAAAFKNLFDTSAAFFADTESREFISVSKPLEDLFGYTYRNELRGKLIDVLIPNTLKGQHIKHIASYHAYPIARLMTTRKVYGVSKDGSEIPVLITLYPMILQERKTVLGFVFDLRDVKASEGVDTKVTS